MKIDRQSRQKAKRYFRACLKSDGTLDESSVRELVGLLAKNKPRGYFAVLSRLQQLIEIAVEERTVRVESATPLADQGQNIFQTLENQFGPATRNQYQHNPALLGGLRIRRGSQIWDGSLSGRLDRLKLALS